MNMEFQFMPNTKLPKKVFLKFLSGFQRNEEQEGFEIIKVKGWDYADLVATYERAGQIAREEHVPVLIHVIELTQPQGHSTSGSHERYKNEERLDWERNFDCIKQMKLWMIAYNIGTEEELNEIEKNAKKEVLEGKKAAWEAYLNPIKAEKTELITLIQNAADKSINKVFIQKYASDLESNKEPLRKDIL
jgi:TPP-dependent pyruvate/acetoin dehydrogenase alpha subunit